MNLAVLLALWAINTPTATWQWTPATGPVSVYEVETTLGTTFIVDQPRVSLPPIDREAHEELGIRVRAFDANGHGGPWSEWTDDAALGVPIGYDSDWDRDGFTFGGDFLGWAGLFEKGVQWLGR